ncbi:MAG: InlB B-repeat-containing protein, partial [Candidatus Onthovivens sp.]|nr:InlB B-repeat-containing protein [Candidatus Onthovivens sp.]
MIGKNKFFSILILFVFLLNVCSLGGSSNGGAEESYTIKWKNYDGTTLETDDVKKGVLPTYDGPTPKRSDDDEYTYTWSGWDPEVVPAIENQTYVATYSYEKTAYTINFDLNGGTSVSYNGSKTVEEFTKDVFFFDCVKEGWNFRGWSYNGTKILDEKGNQLANPIMAKSMTFVAIYAQTAKMTIVTNLEGAGVITGEGEYPYNSYVDVSAYAKQGYKFIGWYFQDTLLSNTNEYKYMMWSEDVTLEVRFEIDS